MSKSGISSRLVGKGGVGLVMYLLAKRGFEFAATSEGSEQGDLWVHTEAGICRVEVKTSNTRTWLIRPEQARRVDAFCFVYFPEAQVWVVPSEYVLRVAKKNSLEKGNLHIGRPAFPAGSDRGFHTLAACLPQTKIASPPMVPPARVRKTPRRTKGIVTVTKTLASGDIKTYRYDRATGARVEAFVQSDRTTENPVS